MKLHLWRYGGHTLCGRMEYAVSCTLDQETWNRKARLTPNDCCKLCLRAEKVDDARLLAEEDALFPDNFTDNGG